LSDVFDFDFNNVRGVLEHFVSPFFSTEKGDFWHKIVPEHFVDKRLTDFVDVLESSILFVGFLFSEAVSKMVAAFEKRAEALYGNIISDEER
jgi:hypothetical protein